MKGSLLVVAMVAFSQLVCSARQFQTPALYQVSAPTGDPSNVIAADFNSDGNLDLAVADSQGGGIALLFGNSDGSFQPAIHIKASFPVALASGDFNGDGLPDIAELESSGLLHVLLNEGSGIFQVAATVNRQHSPTSLALADFNGDGHLDIALTNSAQDQTRNGNVAILFGNGDGTLKNSMELVNAGDHPFSVAAADLNGDGFVDLVVADDNATSTGQNTLFILLNRGDGTFAPTTFYQVGLQVLNVVVADLNHDSKPDLAVASGLNDAVGVLLGNGDGTFSGPTFYPTTTLGNAPVALAIADFNLDGNPDIAVAQTQSNAGLLYGNGDGTFQAVLPVSFNLAGADSIVAGDFNKDGAPDLAMPIFSAGQLAILINTQ